MELEGRAAAKGCLAAPFTEGKRLGRNRRLAKGFERLIETSTAMVVVAIIQVLVRRLATR
jgi:hypothetical protein